MVLNFFFFFRIPKLNYQIQLYNYILIKLKILFNKTVLYWAIEKQDIDMIKFLLKCDRIDINAHSVY